MSLVAALDGRFVPPGPAGAPTRGRLDVLPTGRNLTSLDPRALPTPTALALAEKAAAEILRRHLQDHGDWPRRIVFDLWASPTMRTGGEELATALALLGVRPKWDFASNRVTGIEAVPVARLARPRIDVALRVSGLFRDVFPGQMALFAQAIELLARLDEPDEDNPLAAALRRGEPMDRVFGADYGSYGTGAARQTLDGDWTSRAELGETYLASARPAGSSPPADEPPEPAADHRFRQIVATSDALVHPQDDRERDILDADGVADYVGGFAAAAAALGREVPLYQIDSSAPGTPKARTIAEEVARVVRGRLTNPAWIAGQMRHGHRGAAEMSQAVDAAFAMAAMAGAVTSRQFDDIHDAFVADPDVSAFIRNANPEAGRSIARRLEDAARRGLWRPRRNAVAEEWRRLAGETTESGP
ncbi:MAG: cobaltochelatase subunit CobN [Hyphomicrobiaceae bacterium]